MFQKTSLRYISGGLLLISLVAWGGCLTNPDPYRLLSQDPFEADPADAEDNNNDFARASRVNWSNDGRAEIAAVLTLNDVDVYDLGAVAPGDKLTVNVIIPDRILLNAVVAIFDEVGRLFFITGEFLHITNDPLADARFPAFTPKFDFTVRQATTHLYLAIASQAELVDPIEDTYRGFTGGPYSIDIRANRGGAVPAPQGQVVLLHFDQATVDYPPFNDFGNNIDNVPATISGFNPQVLDPAFWAQDPFFVAVYQMVTGAAALPAGFPQIPDQIYLDSDQFLRRLKTAMSAKFAGQGLNLDFRLQGIDEAPAVGTHSTLYFTSDTNFSGLYGLASSIDVLNQDHTDFTTIWAGEMGFWNALELALELFAEQTGVTFTPAPDPMWRTPQEAAQMVGIIAVHELGHILGLNHTTGNFDIMVAGPTQDSFRNMLSADWSNVPLHTSIFPIGKQDSFLMLLLALGLE